MTTPFPAWLAAVDAIITRKYGVSLDDLPDCNTADWHEDGYTPRQAAAMAVDIADGGDGALD